ncbi:MAG: PAS domain S-box protein [Pedobacter sp.]|nr:PAS domain S-box protein [Pedobacter sp.]MDQ8053219.1 PAS domain S-box protein [Pedobacter sp.]
MGNINDIEKRLAELEKENEALRIRNEALTLENNLGSERIFKSIALNIPKSLIIVFDKNQRMVMIEGELMQRLGFDSSIFIGKPTEQLTYSAPYETTADLYNRVLQGEKFTIERRSDAGQDYIVHFVPLTNDEQVVEGGLMIALDVSDVKIAEEKSAKLAAIIESTDDAIVSKTLESIITSWNPSAERTFGYTAEEMIGESILKIIPDDRKHEETIILSRLKNGERVEHFETVRQRKDGGLIDVSLSISPILDEKGTIIGLSKIARDITERKQEQQRKNDFVAIVSHELKTPLTSITGYIQLLLAKARKEGNDGNLNILVRAESQAKRMAIMIQDFLDLAKMEEGKLVMKFEPFELRPLINDIIADPQFDSPYHPLSIEVPEGIHLNGDRLKIGQVLINLLGNAIKYSPDGGKITISAKVENHQVNIAVSDEGVGVSPLHQKRLFDRFYRVNDDRIKSVSGFGLGLYLVSEILRYHDSHIQIQSEEGVGSTFSFSLPLVDYLI